MPADQPSCNTHWSLPCSCDAGADDYDAQDDADSDAGADDYDAHDDAHDYDAHDDADDDADADDYDDHDDADDPAPCKCNTHLWFWDGEDGLNGDDYEDSADDDNNDEDGFDNSGGSISSLFKVCKIENKSSVC